MVTRNEELSIIVRLRDFVSRNASRIRKEIAGMDKAAGAAAGSFGRTSSAMVQFGVAGAGLITAAFAARRGIDLMVRSAKDMTREMVTLAARSQETKSAFDATFGDASEGVERFVTKTGGQLGRFSDDLRETLINFQATVEPLGFASDDAIELSKALTEVSIDVASFRNIRDDASSVKFLSAIVGETEAVKTLGINIREGAVAEEAFRIGIAGASDELTEQQKVVARFSLIIESVQTALGDALRTQDSFANRQRRIVAGTKEIAGELGEEIIEALNKSIEALGGVEGVILRIGIAFEFTKKIAVGTVAVFTGLIKDAERFIAVFRELNNLGFGSKLTADGDLKLGFAGPEDFAGNRVIRAPEPILEFSPGGVDSPRPDADFIDRYRDLVERLKVALEEAGGSHKRLFGDLASAREFFEGGVPRSLERQIDLLRAVNHERESQIAIVGRQLSLQAPEIQRLRDLNAEWFKYAENQARAADEARRFQEFMDQNGGLLRSVRDGVSGFSNAIANSAAGFGTLRENMEDFFRSFLQRIAASLIELQLLRGASAFLSGAFGFDRALVDQAFGLVASAKGNVFSGGQVQAFGRGGAFTNSIVNRPTLAPMALFGEGGREEAIMPLRRDSRGNLGVSAGGGGGGATTIVMSFLDAAQADEWIIRRRDQIAAIIQEKMFSDPTMRSVMRGGEF